MQGFRSRAGVDAALPTICPKRSSEVIVGENAQLRPARRAKRRGGRRRSSPAPAPVPSLLKAYGRYVVMGSIIIATVRITAQATPKITNSLPPNFSQVVYSTLASARPPMMAPEVGVNRFTRPLPAE